MLFRKENPNSKLIRDETATTLPWTSRKCYTQTDTRSCTYLQNWDQHHSGKKNNQRCSCHRNGTPCTDTWMYMAHIRTYKPSRRAIRLTYKIHKQTPWCIYNTVKHGATHVNSTAKTTEPETLKEFHPHPTHPTTSQPPKLQPATTTLS